MTARGQSVADADRDVQLYLVRIAGTLGEFFGDDLVGLYVYGSLAAGEYRRDASPIDLAAVIAASLSDEKRKAAGRMLARLSALRPVRGDMTMTVFCDRHVRRYVHPLPYELRHGHALGGEDLAMQIADVRARGVTLVGPPAATLFGSVPAEHIAR